MKKIMLLDIGGTKIKAQLRPEIFPLITLKSTYITHKIRSEESLKKTLEKIKNELNINKKTNISYIQVASAGKVNKGKVTSSNLKLKNYDLKSLITDLFLGQKVTILNDSVAASYSLKPNQSVIFASTGIGSATNNKNTELGIQTKIAKKDPINTVKYTNKKQKNSLENLATNKAFKQTNYDFTTKNYGKELAIKAKEGDIQAENILQTSGRFLGYAIAEYYLYQLNNKQIREKHEFVIDGSLGLNEHYFEGIKTGIKEYRVYKNKDLKSLKISQSKSKNSSELIFKGLMRHLKANI